MSGGNSIDEIGAVGGSKNPWQSKMDANRAATEAKMNAELLANKVAAKGVKVDDKQNQTAGTTTNQNDYNKKASDEMITATNMDGSTVIGNNIRMGDQADTSGGDLTGGGQKDHVAAVKLASAKFDVNFMEFPDMSKSVKNALNTAVSKGITATVHVADALKGIESDGNIQSTQNNLRMAKRIQKGDLDN